jgi:hypothetical protein
LQELYGPEFRLFKVRIPPPTNYALVAVLIVE